MHKFTKKLSSLALCPLLCVSLSTCRESRSAPVFVETVETELTMSSVQLRKTEDRGEAYLDSFVFFGESTTYHLKSRGVLRGGTETTQVWGSDNGTALMDSTITTHRIRYPETGELLTVAQAAAKKRPTYLLLCFGLNGAVANVKRGEDYFKSCYRALINEIQAASPDTKIILGACFPVAENMDMSRYSVTLDELNDRIRSLNAWTLSLCEEEGLRYLDLAEPLTDPQGYLRLDYQVGDGHHLTESAYRALLSYIRTHGYQ